MPDVPDPVPTPDPPVKPGINTTQFWSHLIPTLGGVVVSILGVLVASGKLSQQQSSDIATAIQTAGGAITALIGAAVSAYSSARYGQQRTELYK